MRAIDLARKLLEHPDADVMVADGNERPIDFDFVRSAKYFKESDRFHLDWKRKRTSSEFLPKVKR